MKLDVEKISGEYPQDVIFEIWKESLQDMDTQERVKKRINWAYKEDIYGQGQMWLLKDKDTNNYVGCSALLPRHFLINSKKISGALIADTAVKKKYRLLIPAIKLLKTVIKDSQEFKIIMGFPNKLSENVIKLVGFKKALDISHSIKVMKSRFLINIKIANPRIAKILMPFTLLIDLIIRIFDLQLLTSKKFIGQFINQFDERFDAILEDFKGRFKFLIDKRLDYLSWRYSKNTNKVFQIYFISSRDTSKVLGYVIYYLEDDRAIISDFLWIEEYLKLRQLLSHFIREMSKENVSAISLFTIQDSTIEKTLKKMGFLRVKSQPVWYFIRDKHLNEAFHHLVQQAFITGGDNDSD
jgi:hypothetical protein